MPDRRKRKRLARRLTVFGPAVIVILTGALAYGALRRVLDTRRLVLHTRDVIDASSGLLISMLDGETSQRGFLLTHDTAFLAPSLGAPARADSFLVRLRALTSDNPAQAARVDTLAAKVHRRLGVLDSTVTAERGGRTDLSRGIAQFGPGRSLMSDIRRLIDSVRAEEARLLAVRQESESRSTDLSELTVLIGTLVAGLLAYVVNRSLDAALRDRRAANDRLKEQTVALAQQAVESEQAKLYAQEALHTAEESERRAERLQVATEAFTGALSIEEVANLIVDQSVTALNAQSGGLAVLEADSLRFVAVRNIAAIHVGSVVPCDAPYALCLAVRERRPVIVEDFEEMRRRFPHTADLAPGDQPDAVVAYPLALDERVLGVIIVRFSETHPFGPTDRAFMSAMARIATETLDRARLFEAERSARSEAEAANRAKAAFLASMSHELRTPLQAALGFAQLMRSGIYGEINEQQSEVLARVERSQTHLARLIDDILDFARLEAGRVRMSQERVRVVDVINDLVPLVEPQAVAKHIELVMVTPLESLNVMADRQRLQQILVNIAGNAIKFTPEKGTIRVGAHADGDCAQISVQDTGIGIPADRLQSVFEPFVQVDSSLTRTSSGAGLGLAISRDLARAMGGDIRVESEIGRGSTFYVTLPAAR
jgi:signal transduction histidine kinase/CHASE3 domain sensor protein